MLLLTGARKRELLDSRWEHFDLESRDWRIPLSKNGNRVHRGIDRLLGCGRLIIHLRSS
jgi:integrase